MDASYRLSVPRMHLKRTHKNQRFRCSLSQYGERNIVIDTATEFRLQVLGQA